MGTQIIDEIITKAELLTTDEQLQVIATLAEKVRKTKSSSGIKPRRKWSDLIGLLSYPAYEEDAQAYISRTRQEADKCRKKNN